MFKTSRPPAHCVQYIEHRSTLASSVVAKTTDFVLGISGLEHRSTLASSVVAKASDFLANISGLEHRSTLASSVVAKATDFFAKISRLPTQSRCGLHRATAQGWSPCHQATTSTFRISTVSGIPRSERTAEQAAIASLRLSRDRDSGLVDP